MFLTGVGAGFTNHCVEPRNISLNPPRLNISAQAQLRQAAQNLLAAGMEVSQVAQMLGLSEAQVQAFCQSD